MKKRPQQQQVDHQKEFCAVEPTLSDQEITDLIVNLEAYMASLPLPSLILTALKQMQNELQSGNGDGPTPPPTPDEGELLLQEDFADEQLNDPYLSFWSSTPQAYADQPQYTTHQGKTCGHYYAQRGTNEQTPWQVSINTDVVPEIVEGDSFTELCLEWQEFFVGGYPWPSSGQKMLRLIYDAGAHPQSRKSFDLACLNDGVNLQAAAYVGSDDAWFQNSGERHPEDLWVTWRVWIKMNAPTQSDGFVRISKNGVPFMGGENIRLRNADDSKGYNSWWLGGNYSMQGGVGGLSSNGHRYITGIRWWSTNPDELKF